MTYTQEQTRNLLGISTEVLRHWRGVISYLSTKSGKSARFTFSDLIGLATVRSATNGIGVNISSISKGIDALFQILSKTFWQSLHGSYFIITPEDASIVDVNELSHLNLHSPFLVIPCDTVLQQVQDALIPTTDIPSQRILPFPPVVLKR